VIGAPGAGAGDRPGAAAARRPPPPSSGNFRLIATHLRGRASPIACDSNVSLFGRRASRPVGRVLCTRSRGPAAIHLGLPLPAASCGLPASIGRAALERSRSRPKPAFWPCSRWGLPSRPDHSGRWWSLTPPFHPYPW